MAFNPLRSFRRNQKTLLAGLTIMCMFIFVLQFSAGGGDFFDQVTNWIGYSGRSEYAGNLYGHVVTGRDIELLQMRRQLANEYMLNVNGAARGLLMQANEQQWKELPPDVRFQLEGMLKNPQIARNPQSRFIHMSILQRELVQKKKEKEAEQVQALIQSDLRMARLPQPFPGMLYFGGTLDNLDELFMFQIWLHKADELGIYLDSEDVTNLVLIEAQSALQPKMLQNLYARLLQGRTRGVDANMIYQGLVNEFRVRLARSAIVGYDLRPFLVAPGVTPYDMWEQFHKQRTANEVAVLPITVDQEAFLAKVGDATDEELRKLFDKYKDKEPDPASAEGGFKQPARIEVAWLNADPTSTYYRDEARKLVGAYGASLQLGQQILTGGILPMGSGLGAAANTAAVLATPLDKDLIALSRYEFMIIDRPIWHRNPTYFRETLHFHEQSVARGVAAMVGQAAGSTSSFGSLWTAPAAYKGTVLTQELQGAVRLYGSMFLAGAADLPLLGYAQARASTPAQEFRSFEHMREEAIENAAKTIAENLVNHNLNTVQEDMRYYAGGSANSLREKLRLAKPEVAAKFVGLALGDALTGGPGFQGIVVAGAQERQHALEMPASMIGGLVFGPSALTSAAALYERDQLPGQRVEQYLALAAKRYHLELGKTEQPRDKDELDKDKGLAPLRDATRNKDLEELKSMYGQWPTYFPMPIQDSRFQFWKTADYPAYVPTFEEAKPRVLRRWKVEQ
ncbi:MAG: hypothetical protein AB7K24_25385, partial [Gemmataceae bacterium]